MNKLFRLMLVTSIVVFTISGCSVKGVEKNRNIEMYYEQIYVSDCLKTKSPITEETVFFCMVQWQCLEKRHNTQFFMDIDKTMYHNGLLKPNSDIYELINNLDKKCIY